MKENLEISRMAIDLAVATLQSKELTHSILLSRPGEKLPAPMAVFDAIYDHLSTKLTPQ